MNDNSVHFGVKLRNREGGNYLTKENYCSKTNVDKNNDYFLYRILNENEIEIIDKEWTISYLTKLQHYLNDLSENEVYKLINRTKEDIYNLLDKEKNKEEHLVNLKNIWKKEKSNIIFDDYVNKTNESFQKFINQYDLDSDILGRVYTNEKMEEHYKDVMINYDLNINYFNDLDRALFNKELNRYLKKHKKFVEVLELKSLENISGYYILVSDKYKQVYIGTSSNIYRRIRGHWSNKIDFYRMIFPGGAVYSSKMSIMSLRALDTTRIFVLKTKQTFDLEEFLVDGFSEEFLMNRISGGITDGMVNPLTMIKYRKL